MNRKTTTQCLMLLGILFVTLPQPASAQSTAAPIGQIWSYGEGARLIEIAAKPKQRSRLPACPANAGATTTCSCPVSGKSPQICKPGEVCSSAGCGA